MDDFIFGTFRNDDLKLIHERAINKGLQHRFDISPAKPIAGQPVQLNVRLGGDFSADYVACYYTVDGSSPEGKQGLASHGEAVLLQRSGVVWNNTAWAYSENWIGEIPAQPEGTLVKYRIGAWSEDQKEVFADWPDAKQALEIATKALFDQTASPTIKPNPLGRGREFGYHINSFEPPHWAREAVFYHVYADRFFPGESGEWNKTKTLQEFQGGTLFGVRDKLDYIEELGATAILLSPIWPSASYHGYDVVDYNKVADHLGGNEALKSLVEGAHRRNMRVILDLVCNHVSSEHPYFVDALRNQDSPVADYFSFEDSEIGYRTFFGVQGMPQVNLQNGDARIWMIDIARFWLREFQVDGFRLDHANGPGPEFWAEFRAACRETNEDCLCLGEVVEPPDQYVKYAASLDGLLDFGFCESIRDILGRGQGDRKEWTRFLTRHSSLAATTGLLLPTFLDNHDMRRFLDICDGDIDRLRQAAEIQFQLPGPPIIYYGTEVGMARAEKSAANDDLVASRAPMLWGASQDRGIFSFYQTLIERRKQTQPWIIEGLADEAKAVA